MALTWDKNTRVFMDTSSLMMPGVSRVFEDLIQPELNLTDHPLIVPTRVVDELKRKFHDLTSDEAVRQSAKEGILLLQKLQLTKAVEFRGESNDSFADNVFLAVFTRYRTQKQLVLFTQDRKLALEILRLSDSAAVNHVKGIEALRLGRDGTVDRWELSASAKDGVRYRSTATRGKGRPVANLWAANAFRIVDTVHVVPDATSASTSAPKEGDVLRDKEGNRYPLRTLIGQGGEGSVFACDRGIVCKVYRPDRATAMARAKLDLMTSRQLDHAGICWPKAVLFDSADRFVGYAMSRAAGREIQKTLFIKPVFLRTFPAWDKLQVVTLAQSILRGIEFLHAHNVLVGDLNPRNILVETERRVFFVDTDSFQVEGYPSPVGMPPYLAPELIGVDLARNLRTREHEMFAVATLMFMLLVPGKPPYSHCGGESPANCVKLGHFPYALGERKGQGVPDGPWRFIWSNLPFYVKEGFSSVFMDGLRPSVTDWIDLMLRYKADLSKNRVPRDLFPTEFKPLSQKQVEEQNGTWTTCGYCTRDFGWFGRGKVPSKPMCRNCAMKSASVTCGSCATKLVTIRLPDYAKRQSNGQLVFCEACESHKDSLVCKRCKLHLCLATGSEGMLHCYACGIVDQNQIGSALNPAAPAPVSQGPVLTQPVLAPSPSSQPARSSLADLLRRLLSS